MSGLEVITISDSSLIRWTDLAERNIRFNCQIENMKAQK